MSKQHKTSINLLGNLFGKAWVALMSLVFIPTFLLQLGSEGYGLIGIYISIFTLVNILDLGLSIALNRSLAIIDYDDDHSKRHAADTLKTFEAFYFFIGLIVACGVFLASPAIASHWLVLDKITVEQATSILRIMALVILSQWPSTLYSGGLLGIGKQVELNFIKGIHATLQWGGTLLFLIFVDNSLEIYFYCQLGINTISTIWMRLSLWQSMQEMDPSYSGRIDVQCLNESKKFITGLGFFTLILVLVLQSDRLMVSKLLPLDQMGYYAVATQVASVMMYIGVPIYHTIFPKISQMIHQEDPSLDHFYNKSTQLMGLLAVPVCIIIAFYSKEIILLWSSNLNLAENTHEPTSFAVIGLSIYIYSLIPQSLFLGSKRTFAINIYNGCALILAPIAHYFMIDSYGLMGAVITMIGYFLSWHLFLTPFIHQRVLRTKVFHWLVKQILFPLSSTILVFYTIQSLFTIRLESWFQVPALIFVWFILSLTFGLSCSDLREMIWTRTRTFRLMGFK